MIRNQQVTVSPKAALRPLYQDFVLPTVAYVAGPGELDYHAQLAPFYNQLGVVAPSLFPRLSVSLLDARAAKFVEKVELPLERLLGEAHDALVREVVREADDGRTARLFDEARGQIEALFERLKPHVAAVDPTLEGAAHGAAGKCLHILVGTAAEKRPRAETKARHGPRAARKSAGAVASRRANLPSAFSPRATILPSSARTGCWRRWMHSRRTRGNTYVIEID